MCSKKNGNWKASWTFEDDRWPTESPVCGRNDGFSHELDEDRLASLGNAIVPQIVYEIFKVIDDINHQNH
jgi:DNA (cytosine-5)-methyltransferase 1